VRLKRVLQGESCAWVRLSAFALLGWLIASVGMSLYFEPASRSLLNPRYWLALIKVGETLRVAEAHYYDDNRSGFSNLSQLAISGMAHSLDRHSAYYNPSQYYHFQQGMNMMYAGIGVKIRKSEQGVLITRVFPGSPAATGGLSVGDQIIEAEKTSLAALKVSEVGAIIRGLPQSSVDLKVLAMDQSIRTCLVTRKNIEMSSVEDWWVDENRTGYLHLSQFTHRTQAEVEDALQSIQARGASSLILDLRGNGGGLLDAAVEVAGYFLPAGQTVVSLRGRSSEEHREYKTDSVIHPLEIPMIVLINKGSASGAELLAGALSKLGRAELVGETSFGKGSVQTVFPMSDQTGLRLTTAKYYLPDNSTIDEKGLDPDHIVPCSAEDAVKLSEQKDLLRVLDANQTEALLGFSLVEDLQLAFAMERVRAFGYMERGK
jgi:carboxyl-terminal processing protease